jgi:hypothetical protein
MWHAMLRRYPGEVGKLLRTEDEMWYRFFVKEPNAEENTRRWFGHIDLTGTCLYGASAVQWCACLRLFFSICSSHSVSQCLQYFSVFHFRTVSHSLSSLFVLALLYVHSTPTLSCPSRTLRALCSLDHVIRFNSTVCVCVCCCCCWLGFRWPIEMRFGISYVGRENELSHLPSQVRHLPKLLLVGQANDALWLWSLCCCVSCVGDPRLYMMHMSKPPPVLLLPSSYCPPPHTHTHTHTHIQIHSSKQP